MSEPDIPLESGGKVRRLASSEEGGKVRRLAAILCADIAGYSRLMGRNAEGTHARVKSVLRDTVNPAWLEHRGRIIKNMGDGFLAMFDSPLEAVRCAIVIQQSMAMHNLIVPEDLKMQYRIGVNLGDVILDQDDIFGDGVNVAARLQTLCAPGDVYISGGIYEQVKNKLVVGYQSLGDEKLKNITDPVHIYRVLSEPSAFARARRKKHRLAIVALAAACLAVTALAGWAVWRYANPFQTEEPRLARTAPAQPPASSPPHPETVTPPPSLPPAPAASPRNAETPPRPPLAEAPPVESAPTPAPAAIPSPSPPQVEPAPPAVPALPPPPAAVVEPARPE